MKPIVLWELRQRRNYILWWTVATAGLMLMLMLIYPSIHDQANKLNSVLNSLPEAVRSLKTGGSSVDIASPVGYLNSQVFYATLPLLFIIMSIGLGSSILAKDEQNHTLELLLSRPISRSKVLAAKALAAIICLAVVGLISSLVIIATVPLVNMNISVPSLLMANLYCLVFSLSFGAIAYMLTAVSSGTQRLAVAVAVLISFGGYIMATLGGLTHYLATPAKLLPYHYYTPEQILNGNTVTGLNVYLIGCFAICLIASWVGFKRRDIY